jgi:hypothetical protein
MLPSGGKPISPPASPVPFGESSFAFFFKPILDSLAAYWWIHPPLSGPGASQDPELQELWPTLPSDGIAPPGLLLPRFAHYMHEDWCDCVGFLNRPDDMDFVQDLIRGNRPFWEADLSFRNVDGAFWLMHSRDDRLAKTVMAHVSAIAGAQASWEDIE